MQSVLSINSILSASVSFTQLFSFPACVWWGMFWVLQLVEMQPRVLFQDESKISSRYNEVFLWGKSHLQTARAHGGIEI